MKTKTKKNLMIVTIIVTLLSTFHVISLTCQSLYLTGWIDPQYSAQWYDKILWLQLTLFIGRLLFGYLFYAFIMLFMFKAYQGFKKGILFLKSNVYRLYAAAASYFFYSFCNINMGIVVQPTVDPMIQSDTTDLIFTLLIVTFALIYNVAVGVSEENKLTI